MIQINCIEKLLHLMSILWNYALQILKEISHIIEGLKFSLPMSFPPHKFIQIWGKLVRTATPHPLDFGFSSVFLVFVVFLFLFEDGATVSVDIVEEGRLESGRFYSCIIWWAGRTRISGCSIWWAGRARLESSNLFGTMYWWYLLMGREGGLNQVVWYNGTGSSVWWVGIKGSNRVLACLVQLFWNSDGFNGSCHHHAV